MYDRPVCATTTRLTKIKQGDKATQGVNLATHLYEFIREIRPSDQAGVDNVDSVNFTPDGKAYAYSFIQNLSELHVVEGLK